MNNHQNRAGQSTREMAERQTRNRVWFAILTIGGILLILLVAYDLHSLGVGGIGAVGVWVAARVVMNSSMSKQRMGQPGKTDRQS